MGHVTSSWQRKNNELQTSRWNATSPPLTTKNTFIFLSDVVDNIFNTANINTLIKIASLTRTLLLFIFLRAARVSRLSSSVRSISIAAVGAGSGWRPELNTTRLTYDLVQFNNVFDASVCKFRTGWWKLNKAQTRNAPRAPRSSGDLWRAWRTAVRDRRAYCSRTESDSERAELPSACAWSGSMRWWPGNVKLGKKFLLDILSAINLIISTNCGYGPSEWSGHFVWWLLGSAGEPWPSCAPAPGVAWTRLQCRYGMWPPPLPPERMSTV